MRIPFLAEAREQNNMQSVNNPSTVLTPIILGGLTGIRSASPLAAISTFETALGDERLQTLLASPWVKLGLQIMALGELVFDKLPFIPARTDLLPMLGRMGLGGIVGALTYPRARLLGALLGAAAAAGVTIASYHIRRTLTHDYGLADPFVALAEDIFVLASTRIAADKA